VRMQNVMQQNCSKSSYFSSKAASIMSLAVVYLVNLVVVILVVLLVIVVVGPCIGSSSNRPSRSNGKSFAVIQLQYKGSISDVN